MKKITTLLLFSLALMAATCQEPDIECYSQSYVDSLTLLNTQNCNEQLMYNLIVIDSLENHILLLQSAFNTDELSVIADTFNFEVVDEILKVEVNKLGHNIWITLTDGSKRTHLDIYDFKRTITLADSLTTVGLWRPE